MDINELTDIEWDNLLEEISDSMDGKCNFIPNPLPELGSIFNLVKGRFHLLGGESGSAKTSFLDSVFVLSPWFNTLQREEYKDTKYDIIYFIMERSKREKIAKWLTWLLFKTNGWLLSSSDLRGQGSGGVISSKVFKGIHKLQEQIHELLDRIQFHDGRISPALIKSRILKKAFSVGTLYTSDSVGVNVNGSDGYVATFSDKTRKLRDGSLEAYIELEHKGTKFTLAQDSRRYFYHNEDTYIFIIVDGIGIVDTSEHKYNVKAAVDAVTNILSDARDIFQFSPVVVSQFNRGMNDSTLIKVRGASMAPTGALFKDSANVFQAADLALALFDPYRNKAYDKDGFYGGYNVLTDMISPTGINRFRSLHVLKNSYGSDGKVTGLKFLGECGYFESLPKHDSTDLHLAVAKIAAGK